MGGDNWCQRVTTVLMFAAVFLMGGTLLFVGVSAWLSGDGDVPRLPMWPIVVGLGLAMLGLAFQALDEILSWRKKR